MRIAAICATAFALLACGERSSEPAGAERIECAISGGEFERDCTVEAREEDRGIVLTIRNPRGGFRRLLLPTAGGDPVAADGAEPASVARLEGGGIEVAIGGDRFRLPPDSAAPAR
ncbi:hypothetical protein [Allosphingosinicella sp.]|jgi:hypothetical protein|uniref:hypothetical protein n=1 Tax=Allosphingosinicella sp. TaxID=2823234 RepID=UPI002EF1668E